MNLNIISGGAGGADEEMALELHKQGQQVRVVNRSGTARLPREIEVMQGNLLEPASLTHALRGATALYHSAGVPYAQWPEVLPNMLEGFIAAGKASGARLVYVDNLYMYGLNTQNMNPNTPEQPNSRKGVLRARLGKRLLEAHRAGEVRATLARGADFFGPGVDNALLDQKAFRNVLEGKSVMWTGRADVPHALTYTPDFARALAKLGERDEALGKVWTVPTDTALSGRQYLELAFKIAGKPAKINVLPRPMVWLGGVFNPQIREFLEMMYQYERPFTVDGSSFAQTFGFEPTPHKVALEQTLESVRKAAPGAARAQIA